MLPRMKSVSPLIALLVVSALAGLQGCARERDSIDRVQPNYLKKSALEDQWYYQRTVVDVPAANGFTFVGSTDFQGMSRVIWDIQEDLLYARRYTELIKNADMRNEVEKNNGRYLGEVIAAFRIQKHFDIVRAYNSTTGEELNVVEENDVDRRWYERDYMRVDWSANLVHNLSLDFEAESVESVPYYVQEFDPETGERNPDAPFFEADGSYFDVTTKLYAKAGTVDYPGYGKIPICWLDPLIECGPGEYTVRHSFLRVDPARQYVPMPYKGKVTEVFGYFTTDRMVYDPKLGIRYPGNERYLNRHNLWKRWYTSDGSPIDPALREPRPVVFYVNREFPQDDEAMIDAAQSAADKWNEIFRDTVRVAGKDPGGQRMFVLCPHNPVQAGDPSECGAPGLSPRLGDVRYSFMAYVPEYMTYGLLGLGPSNNDPETGEIISGMAYVYHHNNLAAYDTVEMLELLAGTRDPQQYIDGVDLTDWVEQVNGQESVPPRTFGLNDAHYMVEKITHRPSAHYWDAERRAPSAEDEAFQREHGVHKWIRPHLEDFIERHRARMPRSSGRGRLASMRDTEIEDLLLDDDIYMAIGHDPRLPITDEVRRNASVLREGFGKFLSGRQTLLERMAAERNMYLPEMADDALMGLARELKDQGQSSAEILDLVRRTVYTAVLSHEVGHALGLMHNFGGSDDAINYFDEYWQIRAADGTVGPRVVDPITEYEVNEKIYNYAYTSIMDYAGRLTIDGNGPGKYDRAAIVYGYTNKVEVFNTTAGVSHAELRDWFESDGDIINFWVSGPASTHYTSFYNRMGSAMYDASNRDFVDASEFLDDFSRTQNGKARVPYIYCSHSKSNLGDNCLTRDHGADASERMKNILDDLNTWYIVRNFPRGEVGRDHYSYAGNYYGRIFDRLKRWHDIYGLYTDFLPRFYTADQLQQFFTDPVNGWGAKTWGVQNAFNYLIQTILSPDVAGYDPMVMPDGTPYQGKSPYLSASFNLGVDQARYFSTSWWGGDMECGYNFWECLHHIGFYLDKIMAIEALTDSETNFVARASPEDLREWEVSYYNSFPEQITKLNEALMNGDFSKVGPYVQGGKLTYPNYAGPLETSHGSWIDPSAGFTVQMYWQLLGQARFIRNFDYNFYDESRVFVLGTGQAPEVDPQRMVTFADPVSGVVYGALKFEDRVGGGEALLSRANDLLARSTFCENDCLEPAGEHTREGVSATLLDMRELIRVISLISVYIDAPVSMPDPYFP